MYLQQYFFYSLSLPHLHRVQAHAMEVDGKEEPHGTPMVQLMTDPMRLHLTVLFVVVVLLKLSRISCHSRTPFTPPKSLKLTLLLKPVA